MIEAHLLDAEQIDHLYIQHQDFEISTSSFEDTSIMSIFKTFSSNNLFGKPTLQIIKNAKFLYNKTDKLKKKEEEIFIDLLNLNSANKVIFILDKPLNESLNYISKLKYLKDQGNVSMEIFLKENKINISKENLKYLENNIATGYNIKQELQKLNLFFEGKEITKNDIDEHVAISEDVTIFNFIQSIIEENEEKKKKQYIKIFQNEDFEQVQVLAIMHSQVKFYMQVKLLNESGKSTNEITKTLSTSTYRVQKTIGLTSKVSQKTLASIYKKIATYDYLIRSGNTKEENIIVNFLLP